MTDLPAKRVLLLGATGTIGRAAATALVARGHQVVCFVRAHSTALPQAAEQRVAADLTAFLAGGLRDDGFDAIISCLASRTGRPKDAWAIDYQAQVDALRAAKSAGIAHMVLLSAICVQTPKLAFQHAKLEFERQLIRSGLTYSIVRPTAYFKSLSGQVNRLRQGKPFLLFGDGRLTACKPISDADLAGYLVDCLDDPALQNRILPIGGPGPAITPLDQGIELFRLLNMPPKFRHVPLGFMDAIIATLGAIGKLLPSVGDKAELARIGRFYASESMLVWDPATGKHDADATPSTGKDRLFDHYAALVRGDIADDRGDHAVF